MSSRMDPGIVAPLIDTYKTIPISDYPKHAWKPGSVQPHDVGKDDKGSQVVYRAGRPLYLHAGNYGSNNAVYLYYSGIEQEW